MPRKFQDIIPPDRRSIRNIPLADRLDPEPLGAAHEVKKIYVPPNLPHHNQRKSDDHDISFVQSRVDGSFSNSVKKKRTKLWILAIAFILIAGFALLSKMATANIDLVASAEVYSLANSFTLSHNSSSTNAIDYDILTLSTSAPIPESAFQSTPGVKSLGTKAKGTVTFYNDNATSQVLVQNTRLESSDGKIFRLVKNVTIPARKDNLKNAPTPGTVTGDIIADEIGSKYNVGIKDFTLPGFKDTAKYKTITAKTKVAIAGGTDSSVKPVINPATLQKIKNDLMVKAEAQIAAQKPDDYIVLPGAIQYIFDNPGTTQNVSATALLLKKKDLLLQIQTQKNTDKNLAVQNTGDIQISTSSLSIGFASGTKFSNITADAQFSIVLNGTTSITSDTNEARLKKQLSGLSIQTAEDVLKAKPGIDAVSISVWPWWIHSIPTNINRINIKIESN